MKKAASAFSDHDSTPGIRCLGCSLYVADMMRGYPTTEVRAERSWPLRLIASLANGGASTGLANMHSTPWTRQASTSVPFRPTLRSKRSEHDTRDATSSGPAAEEFLRLATLHVPIAADVKPPSEDQVCCSSLLLCAHMLFTPPSKAHVASLFEEATNLPSSSTDAGECLRECLRERSPRRRNDSAGASKARRKTSGHNRLSCSATRPSF